MWALNQASKPFLFTDHKGRRTSFCVKGEQVRPFQGLRKDTKSVSWLQAPKVMLRSSHCWDRLSLQSFMVGTILSSSEGSSRHWLLFTCLKVSRCKTNKQTNKMKKSASVGLVNKFLYHVQASGKSYRKFLIREITQEVGLLRLHVQKESFNLYSFGRMTVLPPNLWHWSAFS